ncbi:hydroxymethylglutaryl-CoA lyase [Thioclava sp. F1Mire-8]|uniref:hydroxymethylglutaryl-CoA lyase n=1 Tax=Thioclava sp. F1Mire-8 TaxID=1973006 RepID=UPI000B548AEC|nr:hydroxymethylglutaryl-CoA lyase [Thioclava sp. F1Mire-8]OWY05471.1 hydroxymethylglutaryl-CoA lyase [Thioclava sp. F1Mire-8]
MAESVEIFEMAPRDGLQNEKRQIALSDKIALVDCLSRAGFRRIEVGSFVSPKWVPQMADSAEVFAGIARRPGVSYAALTPNMKGYEAAKAAKADEVAIFASASEGFSRANLNCSISESLERFLPIMEAAKADNVKVRGYISVVTDCPFDGKTPPESVARVAAQLRDMGCYEISLGDTIGQGTPESVTAMLRAVLNEVPAEKLAGHFHDTSGRALENIEASLEMGLRVFDACVGGLGGCPYAPGAAGNVATETVQARLGALGYETGLDSAVLAEAAAMAKKMKGQGDV